MTWEHLDKHALYNSLAICLMKYIPHFYSCYNSKFQCKIFQFQVSKQVSKPCASIIIWERCVKVCTRNITCMWTFGWYDDVYQCLNPLKIYIEFRYWINVHTLRPRQNWHHFVDDYRTMWIMTIYQSWSSMATNIIPYGITFSRSVLARVHNFVLKDQYL